MDNQGQGQVLSSEGGSTMSEGQAMNIVNNNNDSSIKNSDSNIETEENKAIDSNNGWQGSAGASSLSMTAPSQGQQQQPQTSVDNAQPNEQGSATTTQQGNSTANPWPNWQQQQDHQQRTGGNEVELNNAIRAAQSPEVFQQIISSPANVGAKIVGKLGQVYPPSAASLLHRVNQANARLATEIMQFIKAENAEVLFNIVQASRAANPSPANLLRASSSSSHVSNGSGPNPLTRVPSAQQQQKLHAMLEEVVREGNPLGHPGGMQWLEAKDGAGRVYFYNPDTQKTHWYNPKLVEHGLKLLLSGQPSNQIPTPVVEHLKMFKMERQQNATQSAAAAASQMQHRSVPLTEEEQKQQLEKQLKMERDRAEMMRLQQEEMLRMKQIELERQRQWQEHQAKLAELEKKRQAEAKIYHEKAKKEIKPLARWLLRKMLDTIGYEEELIGSDIVKDSLVKCEPGAYQDPVEATFRECVERSKTYYDEQEREKEAKNEEMERDTMLEHDFDAGGNDERAHIASAKERQERRLDREFNNFFKFRSFKAMQTNDWTGEKKEQRKLEEAQGNGPKRRKKEKKKAKVVADRRPRRQVKSRLINVEGHMVLKENNYTMEEGSVQQSQVSGLLPVDLRRAVRTARSAFNLFSSRTSKQLKIDNPHFGFRDIQKNVAELWKALTPKEREEFDELSRKDRIRYNEEIAKAMDQEQKNMEHNQRILREQQEKEDLIQRAKDESKEREMNLRATESALLASNKGQLPKVNYDDLVMVAAFALGPRSQITVDRITAWITATALGRLLISKLKNDYDPNTIPKSVRKMTNKGRFEVIVHGQEPFRVRSGCLVEIADSFPLRITKQMEKEQRSNSTSTSVTAERARRAAELEKARTTHRDQMLQDIFEANQKQWAFMYRHQDVLQPFITTQVKERLEKAAQLLRDKGLGELLESDPSGYDQEDEIYQTTSPPTPGFEEGEEEGDGEDGGNGNSDDNGDTPMKEEEEEEKQNLPAKIEIGKVKENGEKPKPKFGKRRERPAISQPSNIAWGNMRDYQLEGLRWLVSRFENGINAILADEMGLGKTLQTISFLTHLKYEMGVGGPYLVIVPLSVLTAWANEFQRWSPEMRIVKLHSSSKEERDRLKRETLSDPSCFDVVITTFEMIISQNMRNIFSRMWWRYVVIDEGHKIKNDETDLSVAVRSINCQGRLLLTGTPLQNNLHELWSLLNYLYPSIFTESETFDSCFDISRQIVETDMLAKAHYLIRPFVLRRTKGEVKQKMPPKEEIEVKIPLSKMQKHWYKMLLVRDAKLLQRVEDSIDAMDQAGDNAVEDSTSGNSQNDWKKLQSLMVQLRKCCNHPYLFPNAEPVSGPISEDIVEASGKLKILDRILHRLRDRGHRVVIFSQFTATLNILEDYFKLRGFKYSRLDGSTNRVQRAIDIMQYNKENSEYFAYLMSTRAGGLGINLATADTVVLYDSDWNPQVDLQAQDRVHRIGQTKPVHVYRLVTTGTVEERVVQRAKKKLYLDRMVNRGSTSQAEALETLSKAEMLKMLKFGASAVFGAKDGSDEITDNQLDQMMDRSHLEGKEEGDEIIKPKMEGSEVYQVDAGLNALEFDGTQESMDIRNLEGVVYNNSKNDNNDDTPSASSSANPKKRGREEDEDAITITPGMSMSEIAEQWAAKNPELYDFSKPKRARTSRYLEVDGHTILKANNYSLEEGEKSVFQTELSAGSGGNTNPVAMMSSSNTSRQVAGRDYDNEGHCLVCWDGGELLLCDQCCASYHEHCLHPSQLPPKKKNGQGSVTWGCPHHSCKICGRKAAASGGMLFRCTECPNTFCEDHLQYDHVHLNENGREVRFEELGQRKPAQAYFMRCSDNCKQFAETRLSKGVLAAIKEAQSRTAAAKKLLENGEAAQPPAASNNVEPSAQ